MRRSRDRELVLISRLLITVIAFLGGDIAFTRHRDAGIKAELVIARDEHRRLILEIEELTTEITLLSALRQTGLEYYDERLDAVELFLGKLDPKYIEQRGKRLMINEQRIQELLGKLENNGRGHLVNN